MLPHTSARRRCLHAAATAAAARTHTRSRRLATLAPDDSRSRAHSQAHQPTSSTVVVPNYAGLFEALASVRKARLPSASHPLTLAEKILYSHLTPATAAGAAQTQLVRGDGYLKLTPDRVAMQDASAQMAILQFMLAKRATTAVPTSIHCDHLIPATQTPSADADVADSKAANAEIYSFLQLAAKKYGVAFWPPGAGIIHQIVLENYAAPGTLMLGTDSHTPNAGGLGMLAIGVGGADAVDAMAGIPWELKAPRVLGIKLTGRLSGWTSPKDVILHIAGRLTVRGGTNHIIEYFGPGCETLSCTGMATICNMGAEVGATTSTFPYTQAMSAYLRATGRAATADAADIAKRAGFLSADANAKYDSLIEIDLSTLEPHINGPFTPDLATPLSKFKDLVKENKWKDEIQVALIGSCTNSSYEDMRRAADLAQQAADGGLQSTKSQLLVTPGSEQIRATIERDGVTATLERASGQMLSNSCGPCIGQWNRTGGGGSDAKEENAILSSFNRNFRSRNDGNAKTMNFLASPEIVTAMAFSGRLTFNPMTDSLPTASGRAFRFQPPQPVASLPTKGFTPGRAEYLPPPAMPKPDPSTTISISPTSTRLQLLEPFAPWDGKEYTDVQVLGKFVGKCTTDHISAAGPWLKYKGHLENISANTLIGAHNAFTGAVNSVHDFSTLRKGAEAVVGGGEGKTIGTGTVPEVAKRYKENGIPWCVIAAWNYGEGSAREHAALQPRYLGCNMIIAQSFARIHETNLKKQGVLPLTFVDPADYDRIVMLSPPSGGSGIRVSTRGVVDVLNGNDLGNGQIKLVLSQDGCEDIVVRVAHSLSEDQVGWIRAGSALNLIAGSL
ncbi:aconitate hydratase [Geranomyces michiganensis]|nr:aconitate hydratase [Geranomyces michiganensis]